MESDTQSILKDGIVQMTLLFFLTMNQRNLVKLLPVTFGFLKARRNFPNHVSLVSGDLFMSKVKEASHCLRRR